MSAEGAYVWPVWLDRSQGAHLGVEFDSSTLEINSIKDEGLVAAWNAAHPAAAVAVGDQVVQANGKTRRGDGAAELVRELRMDTVLELRFLRASSYAFRVDIDRAPGTRLGVAFKPKSDVLEISAVANDGALAMWNSCNPRQPVRQGDHIVEVNGKHIALHAADALVGLMKDSLTVHLEIVRHNSDGSPSPEPVVTFVAAGAEVATPDGADASGRHHAVDELFRKLAKERGGTKEELRAIFDEFSNGSGSLSKEVLRELLECQRRAEGVRGAPLPDGFVDVLWTTWSQGAGAVNEKQFLGGYRVYLRQHATFLDQYLLATKASIKPQVQLADLPGFRDLCATIESSGGKVSHNHVEGFCASWVVDQGEDPPPPAFCRAVFQAMVASAGDSGQLGRRMSGGAAAQAPRRGLAALHAPDGTLTLPAFRECAEAYVRNWRAWLQHWLEDQRTLRSVAEGMQTKAIATQALEKKPAESTPTTALAKLQADLLGEDVSEVFQYFDSGGKGFWSAEDVEKVCTELFTKDGAPAPPRAFRDEASRLVRGLAAQAVARGGRAAAVPPPPPQSAAALGPDDVRLGLAAFARRRHNYLQTWAHRRYGSSFQCSRCSGCFRVRLDPDGHEVAAISGGQLPSQVADRSSPSSGSPIAAGPAARPPSAMLPQREEVASLHESIARNVARGVCVVALPAGAARPALGGRLLLEASAVSTGAGALVLLASEREVEAVAVWLAALVPEQAVLRLGDEVRSLRPRLGGPVYLGTPAVFLHLLSHGKVRQEQLETVFCCCSTGEVPLVSELDESAPFSITSKRPRVVCLLDGSDEVHRSFVAHLEAVAAARQHLVSALDHLESLRVGLPATGVADAPPAYPGAPNAEKVAQETEGALHRLLGEAARYPVVEAMSATLATAGRGAPAPLGLGVPIALPARHAPLWDGHPVAVHAGADHGPPPPLPPPARAPEAASPKAGVRLAGPQVGAGAGASPLLGVVQRAQQQSQAHTLAQPPSGRAAQAFL